jgi:hypothetical protein
MQEETLADRGEGGTMKMGEKEGLLRWKRKEGL